MPPLLAFTLTDVFVLIGGAVSAFVTVGGAVYALTRYILERIRKIAREESASQHEILNTVVQQNSDVLKHIELLEVRTGNTEKDVAHLKGWTQGFTAGAQARKETTT